ncbi:PAK1 interacting protein (macronuclear) [Tetrahymena thermophila SB210]|uniref:PAK1 interacting protein n=1 Tax=Tetrahymena thermophila (strain SB210) TaxID=312017 RepID=Q22ML2_TETTS|nr:PAK1 interacting protein [Tetrahymena thermophila SB210]EAR86262.1 PAK1 interacting protein [Tetrahymena thermophila SB210]|eukprot:XP_977008.1 PAK1 interacting protein [Tetrahymena thermophila SB210]
MSNQVKEQVNQNELQQDIVENIEDISTKQKFTVFVGTYEGAILGMVGDLSKLELKYAFKPSTNSLKCMDVCGKYLVVGGFDEYVRVYDLKRQRECGTLEAHLGTITSIKSHQSIAFSCAEDGLIMAWKMKEFGLLHKLKEHKSAVHDIAIHTSGKIMASIGKDKRLIIWNLINAKKVFSINLKYNAYKIELTQKNIVLMSDFSIHIIDQESNQEICELQQDKQVTLNDFCVYNEVLVITGDNNGYIYIYDIETKQSISFKAHDQRVKKLCVQRIDDIDIIISISTNGEIHMFDCLIIFSDVFEIQESQVLNDIKPIYKVNTLNRLTSLTVYMDAAKDKPQKDQGDDEEKEKLKKIEEEKLLKQKQQEKKKKNQKKIKVTIEKEDEAKTYVIDSSKIAKKIEKKKKKQLKKQQKAAMVKGQQQQQQQQKFQQQKQKQNQEKPQQQNQPNKQQNKQKKSVRFQ